MQIFLYNTIFTNMENQKKFSYLDEFKIVKTLGAGYHAQVKLGVDQNGKKYAIKRYKKQTASLSTLKHQLSVMKNLNHQNIVKLIDVRENATYKSRHEKTYKCFAIILEYVGGGELFDYIADTGKFSQKVTRTYFHQFMNGLHYMHCKGYAHRDIKPQNILLSHQFILKLADFGFSCLLTGKDHTGNLHTKLGTEGYMAPEIPTKNYEGTKIDIFASGVILFIMYAGNPPFEKAVFNDPYYKLLRQKNYGLFWSSHSKKRPLNYFSKNFQDLFIRMVEPQPQDRITIDQIAKHPWVLQSVSTYAEIKKQFTQRQQKLDYAVNIRRFQELNKKEKRVNNEKHNETHSRCCHNQELEFTQIYQQQKSNQRILPHLRLLTKDDFVVKQNIAYLISSLKDLLKTKKIYLEQPSEQDLIGQEETILMIKDIKDEENKVLIKYEYRYGHEKEEITQFIQFKLIFGINDTNNCIIRIQRQCGNLLYYKKIVREIKNALSYCLIDRSFQNY